MAGKGGDDGCTGAGSEACGGIDSGTVVDGADCGGMEDGTVEGGPDGTVGAEITELYVAVILSW